MTLAANPVSALLAPLAGRRVAVAMSGGVDSSVVAALAAEAGCDVVGVTLQLYDAGAAAARPGACCAGADIRDARAVAELIGIPHYVVDMEERFRAAVIDAFAHEPLTESHPFRGVANVLLTPHIGASTSEAQRNVAIDACAAVRDALLTNELSRTLNVAEGGGDWLALQPAILVARRAAAVARGQLAERGALAISSIEIRLGAELAPSRGPLLSAAAVGALEGIVERERLNLINARTVAQARGIELRYIEGGLPPHPRAVEVRLTANGQELRVGGVAALDTLPRITRIGDFHVDVAPRGTLIVLTNRDVPGVIGRVGTALGDAKVNIAEYHQARLAEGGDALAVITVDGDVAENVRHTLLALPDIRSAAIIHFGGESSNG